MIRNSETIVKGTRITLDLIGDFNDEKPGAESICTIIIQGSLLSGRNKLTCRIYAERRGKLR
ncbi:hypothetical protein BMS3Bbin04_01369 [bacterium BMS3Bbin04]|nr:hypothetical protein BMS3Bbin04_01369 [bacterium BMS3Bbin04]